MLFPARSVIATCMVLTAVSAAAQAEAQCQSSKPRETPAGVVQRTNCGKTQLDSAESIHVDGKRILSDKRLFDEARDKSRNLLVFSSGDFSATTACARTLYLLDLSGSPPKVFSFGVKNACNEFHWASWGDKRSVIALKHNVKFVYESGKLTPPAKGEALWKAIEPPHSGPGLGVEDAIPFVEDVPPPK